MDYTDIYQGFAVILSDMFVIATCMTGMWLCLNRVTERGLRERNMTLGYSGVLESALTHQICSSPNLCGLDSRMITT